MNGSRRIGGNHISLYLETPCASKFSCHSGKTRFFWIAAWFRNCGVFPQKAFSRVNKGIQRVNLLHLFMAQLEPTFLGRGLHRQGAYPACPAMRLPVFPPISSVYSFDKEFWPSCKTCTQRKHVRSGFPSVSGVLDCSVFWCDYGVFGCECGVFPRAPEKLIFKGCQHWKTGLILVVRAQSDMQQLASTCTCSRVQMHVGSKMDSIHSPNGWQRSSHHQSSRSQTRHIKSKVVWFSVTASFYQLRRVLDNAACSGKCRQNFSSIPLRPKFWQHEFIGIQGKKRRAKKAALQSVDDIWYSNSFSLPSFSVRGFHFSRFLVIYYQDPPTCGRGMVRWTMDLSESPPSKPRLVGLDRGLHNPVI